jgi:heptosyltransferase-2
MPHDSTRPVAHRIEHAANGANSAPMNVKGIHHDRKASVPAGVAPMIAEGTLALPLAPGAEPRTIMVVRLHAFGDAVIALPVVAALRRRYPDARITVITSREYVALFHAVVDLDEAHGLITRGPRVGRIAWLGAQLRRIERPDLLIDLQRSRLSTLFRRLLNPPAWSAIDRFAPRAAIERYRDGVAAATGEELTLPYRHPLAPEHAAALLERFALPDDGRPLVCLNPAGCWPTKNWPPERYVALGRRLIEAHDARILLLGTENVAAGAAVLREGLAGELIDLVGKTSSLEALALMSRLALMVSDDSGLMHLAWTSGVPTVGLLGASRATWSRPYGPHTHTIGSEDLPCGACMSAECGRGDRHCLERVGVAEVARVCAELLASSKFPIQHSK